MAEGDPAEAPEAAAPPELTAQEQLEADDQRRREQVSAVRRLSTKYEYDPADPDNWPMVTPGEVRADIEEAKRRGIFVEQDVETIGPDATFPGGRLDAPAAYAELLGNVRAAQEHFFDDPVRASERQNEYGVREVTRDERDHPELTDFTLPRTPTVEEASRQRLELVRQGAYRLADGPDGLYNLPRVEGTTPGTRQEIADDRARMRDLEYSRRVTEIYDRINDLDGDAKIAAMVEFAQQGLADGEYTLNRTSRDVPATGGGRGTRKQPYMEVIATNYPQNRELSSMYARAFDDLLHDDAQFTLEEQRKFEVELERKIPAPRLKELQAEGLETQKRGVEAARMEREALARVEEASLSPVERERLEHVRRREARDARNEAARNQRAASRQDRDSLTLEEAYDDAMEHNGIFKAAVLATERMPQEFQDRMARVQAAIGTTEDNDEREMLERSYQLMVAEEMEVYNAGAEAGAQRLADYARDPSSQDRAAHFENWFRDGATHTVFRDTGEWQGADWAAMSSLEREAARPLMNLAHEAHVQGRGQETILWMEEAIAARETARRENERIGDEIDTTAREVAQNAAAAVTNGEQGTFHIGRTTNAELNIQIVNSVREQFNMDAEPSAKYRHREKRLHKDGTPWRGDPGKLVATDLIYVSPHDPNISFIARFNVDGQLVSANVHVTEGTALRQRRDGSYRADASPELEELLNAGYEEVKGSVNNPRAADRDAESRASIGANWASAGTDTPAVDYADGYQVPERGGGGYGPGGVWDRQTIQAGLVDLGLDPVAARQSTSRVMQRRRPGQPRRWWWERAMNRDLAADTAVRRPGV